tara:strand:- start:558947 stop:560950 length:2004 start_codon:yes stop_codon:yes gene_type:complete
MISHFRNILNLNEKFAYSILGKIRQFVLPLFNYNLAYQERKTKGTVIENISLFKSNLNKCLPEVTGDKFIKLISSIQKEELLKAADKAVSHEFNILSTNVKFDEKIDWSLDFSSGFKWPKGKLYLKYNQVSTSDNADVKFPRELSRCHHFLYLGQAYLITGDQKYTKEFIEQVKSWLDDNPYKKSINWCCSMDIGIRAANWIYGLRMFLKSPLIDDNFLSEILTSLYLHGRYIYENPEKNRAYNHNHYLADLAGQILLGVLFEKSDLKETRLWRDNGIYELYREIRIQILPTGFTYERTTNYHRLVTELIAYTLILIKNNELEIPLDISFRVKKMFEVVPNYLFLDGTAPIIGDQDNGRFLPFYPYNINYQRYLLNIGAVLFDNEKLKYFSSDNFIDILFLFGDRGCEKFNNLNSETNKLKSKSFSDAGFYTLKSDKVNVFINNSGFSHYNEVVGVGTHTHSDLLSFVYSLEGVPFLIDPGTYVYSSNPKERKKFRSTEMHNTITVDDFNQNDIAENELWSMRRNVIPSEILWETNEKKDIYEGTHTGYLRLDDPVRHSRRFEFDKTTNKLQISDKIECANHHEIKCHFHFDEGVTVQVKDKEVYCRKKSKGIKISFKLQYEYTLELKQEYISKAYNSRVLSNYIVLSLNTRKNIELLTFIENYENN